MKPDGRSRAPHLKTWRDGWRHLKFLLMYSPKWLFFYPGIFLTLFGLGLSAALMFGPIHLSKSVTLDFNSFLASTMLAIVGTQLITFGALARYYAALTRILPPNPRSDKILLLCKTDKLALWSLALLLLGGAVFAGSLIEWAKVDFGTLTNPIVPRLVASGLGLAIVGVQTGFAAFLFGILEIPKRSSI